MALRLNGSQSQLNGFPGLMALGEPPMSGDLIILNIKGVSKKVLYGKVARFVLLISFPMNSNK